MEQKLIITIVDEGEKGQKLIMDFEPAIKPRPEFDKLSEIGKTLQLVAIRMAEEITKLVKTGA